MQQMPTCSYVENDKCLWSVQSEEKGDKGSAVNQNVLTVNMPTNNQFNGTESFLRRY
jgi:hypothetical protein